MDREGYFSALKRELSLRGLDRPFRHDWRRTFQQALDEADFPESFIKFMTEKAGTALLNVLLVNCRKCVLLCRMKGIVPDKVLMRAAVGYTVLGCMADAAFDGGDTESVQRLFTEKLERYLASEIQCHDSPEDALLSFISAGIGRIRRSDQEKAEHICSLIRRSAQAETDSHGCQTSWEDTAERSVIFVRTSAELLLSQCVLTEEDDDTFRLTGIIYACIDDLCDYFSDRETGQKNLTELLGMKEVLRMLDDSFSALKRSASEEYYDFIRCQTGEWMI